MSSEGRGTLWSGGLRRRREGWRGRGRDRRDRRDRGLGTRRVPGAAADRPAPGRDVGASSGSGSARAEALGPGRRPARGRRDRPGGDGRARRPSSTRARASGRSCTWWAATATATRWRRWTWTPGSARWTSTSGRRRSTMRAFLPGMVRRGGGRVVAVVEPDGAAPVRRRERLRGVKGRADRPGGGGVGGGQARRRDGQLRPAERDRHARQPGGAGGCRPLPVGETRGDRARDPLPDLPGGERRDRRRASPCTGGRRAAPQPAAAAPASAPCAAPRGRPATTARCRSSSCSRGPRRAAAPSPSDRLYIALSP